MSIEQEHLTFNFLDVTRFLYKWRKHLIIITLIAGVISAVVSFMLPPKYKAEVVFYPTTINSISNAMFTDLNKREADFLDFGEEEEAENAIQILKSDKVSQRIIRNFNLLEHYEIDPNGSFPMTKLANRMKKNIKFNRTRYLSVSIEVLDKDPEMAAAIANGIASIYDSVKSEIQRDLAQEAYSIVEEEFKNKEKEVWDLKMKLNELGSKGIIDIEKQAQSISEGLYALKSKGGSPARVRELEAERDTLAKYGSQYTEAYETLILELEELSILRKRYKKAKVDVEKTMSHKFLLTSAAVPEKKSLPRKKLIVALSMLATFAFASILLIFIEIRPRIKG